MRHLTAFAVAAAIGSAAFAAPLATETFDGYSTGNLVGQGPWTAFSGAGSNPIQVVALAPTDNEATVTAGSGSREDAQLPTSATMGAGDKWYAGFDIKVDSGVSGADYFFAFRQDLGASGSGFPTKVGLAPLAGSDFTVYAHQGSGSGNPASPSGTTKPWTSGLTYGQIYRVVMSYTYDTGEGELWIDPIVALGPGGNAKIDIVNASSAGFEAAAFALRQGGVAAGTLNVDNIAVATTWAEAAVIPEPASFALVAAAGLLGLRRRR